MKRKIIDLLISWKNKGTLRQPLILNGARQVGKTYIINEFGHKHYQNVVYVNFETNLAVNADFNENITPGFIIKRLESYYRQPIIPGLTLIFFDEIQACERALTSLKYFCEDAPEYHIIAAGSLLGAAVNRGKYSFPVGKVDLMTLYPLDYEEFLWANGREALVEEIRTCFIANSKLSPMLHDLAVELYKTYLIVGGMPASINEYLKRESYLEAASIQGLILNTYVADMAKYATVSETTKIMAAYNSIPSQLAKDNKKFQWKVIQKGGTATIFGASIDWLTAAGLVMKCNKIEHAYMPPAVYQNQASFKLYMNDVGLLTQKSGISPHNLLTTITENNTFAGAIAENYVAGCLQKAGFSLYYWESDQTAEIDFVIQDNELIIPVEVKSGKHNKAKSLIVYKEKYKPPYAIRISTKNFGFENGIKAVPLYAVFCIEKNSRGLYQSRI